MSATSTPISRPAPPDLEPSEPNGPSTSSGPSAPGGRDLLLLSLISHGLTDERIGEELDLSVAEVRASVGRIVHTMGARNRTHAIALALRGGQIS